MGLVLPKYGDALTLLKPQRKDGDPPPRKTARLDTTASGSVYNSASASSVPGAPKKLSILNGPGQLLLFTLSFPITSFNNVPSSFDGTSGIIH